MHSCEVSDTHIFIAEPGGYLDFSFDSHGLDTFKLNGEVGVRGVGVVESVCDGMRPLGPWPWPGKQS